MYIYINILCIYLPWSFSPFLISSSFRTLRSLGIHRPGRVMLWWRFQSYLKTGCPLFFGLFLGSDKQIFWAYPKNGDFPSDFSIFSYFLMSAIVRMVATLAQWMNPSLFKRIPRGRLVSWNAAYPPPGIFCGQPSPFSQWRLGTLVGNTWTSLTRHGVPCRRSMQRCLAMLKNYLW